MSKKYSILHIIDSLGVGGAENVLAGIINGLTDYENHLIILNGPETILPRLHNIVQFKNLHIPRFWNVFTKYKTVKNYINIHQIDIVHSHLYSSNIISRLATNGNVPVFNTIHSIPSVDIYKRKIILQIEKLTYKKRHHIIAVSKEALKDFDRVIGIKGKGTVLYNFINDKFWQNHSWKDIQFPEIRMVSVGNLRDAKNYPFALEAFKQMPAGVSLDIFGNGPMKNQLQQTIDQYHLPVRLLGANYNLEKLLPDYDLFLMTSYVEGQPVSLLEAMACGLPALISDIPVLREVGGDAALYFSLTSPDFLIQLVKQIQSGKYNLKQFSIEGYARVQGFAKMDHYLNQLNLLYQNALGEKRI